MKKYSLIILLIICCLHLSYAKEPRTTGANFLKLGVGSRPAALGGAFTAANKDIYSLYWNPAGIAEIKNITVSGMHNSWVEDIDYNFIGGVIPLENLVIGVSCSFITMDDITRTIETPGGGYQLSGSFSPEDYLLSISIAKMLTDNFNIGASLKYLKSDLGDADAAAFAIDAGLIYKPENNKITLGAALRNLGTDLKYIDQKEDLPLTFSTGISYLLIDNTLVLLDISKSKDNETKFHTGLEYSFKTLALRIGYNPLSELDNGLTAGIGISLNQFTLDYAFEPQGEFDDSHKISLSYKFGR